MGDGLARVGGVDSFGDALTDAPGVTEGVVDVLERRIIREVLDSLECGFLVGECHRRPLCVRRGAGRSPLRADSEIPYPAAAATLWA